MALSAFILIFLVIEIILYSFHFSLLILMIAERNYLFKGAFFNLFRIVLFADVLCFVAVTFTQKVVLIPFLSNFAKKTPILATVLLNLIYIGNFIQFLGHLFMALNRFTIIWIPLKHERIWKGKHWYTVVIFGVPLLNTTWKINKLAVFSFGADDIVTLVFEERDIQNLNNTVALIAFFSTTIIAAVLNILSAFKFFVYKQTNSSFNVNERNLLYVSLVAFIAQLLRVYYNANRVLFPTNVPLLTFFTAIYPIISGVFAWSGSISLMLLSTSTRKAYITYYFRKSNNQIIQSSNLSAPKLTQVPIL